MFFQVPFDVHGYIDAEVVRDPVFVPVRVVDVGNPIFIIDRNRVGAWPACHIYQVTGEAYTSAPLVIDHQRYIMWPVIIGGIGLSSIDLFSLK